MANIDYSSVPTEVLARETMDKAHTVWKLEQDAWDTCGSAFLFSIPACMFFTLLFFLPLTDWMPWWYTIVVIAGVVATVALAVPFVIRWNTAIRNCKMFTEDMKARNSELRRRMGDSNA